jgi:hypothetical protein
MSSVWPPVAMASQCSRVRRPPGSQRGAAQARGCVQHIHVAAQHRQFDAVF